MSEMEEIIEGFLEDGGYGSIEEWANDSDYTFDGAGWIDDDGNAVYIRGCLEGAIEASGWTLPMQYEQSITLRIKYNPEEAASPEKWDWNLMTGEEVVLEDAGPVVVIRGKVQLHSAFGIAKPSPIIEGVENES